MLRTMIARAGTTALVASLLVMISPGQSDAGRSFKPYGSISSKNFVLKRGCHTYFYRYEITPPTEEWDAEVFIVSPDGTGLASDVIFSAVDKKRGRNSYEVCRPSTTYGKHKLKMKVTFNRGREVFDGFVKPSSFRFKRR
ncbi:hypothetical protein [Nocardioides sp.]|jgi:hypothetical protein|uniref:hypothetical protein n=1 Tax=Nocardioides sp. TaxID=35761 RepID=UPI001DC45F60|nr:hypothetical protein [Nocardioides sp.]MBU1801906.1 hypothetical protein [Actinomycetota bacterium]